MKNVEQENYTETQMIEAEYINSMLNIDCTIPLSTDVMTQTKLEPVTEEIIDFKADLNLSEIDCQVFKTGGLNIAIPVTSLQQTLNQQQISNNNINLQAGVYTAKFNYNGKAVTVIDLAYLAMNDESNFYPSDRDESKNVNIVIFKGGSHGIIYDQQLVTQPISKEQVCWRDETSKRLWLAGTIAKQGMCLLDIEGLIQLLQPHTSNK